MQEQQSHLANWGKRVVSAGVRIGDHLELNPLQGRKRTIPLLRTHYTMTASGDYQSTILGQQILLSSLKDESFKLELKLLGSADDARFCLVATNERAFTHNGNQTFSAMLVRGDRIEIGHNVLTMASGEKSEVREEDLLISQRVIESNLNILLEGETGTGKSHLAQRIHQQSGRRGSFIQLNLSSFGPGLVESELFGHVRGAFTGALRAKEGALSEANYGTLFLDEIDSLSLEMQTKLLLFLDHKEFRPVGGNGLRTVDVRIICASGKELMSVVEQGKMRQDFYYRIAAGEVVRLPSLRESPKRIEFLLKEYCERRQRIPSPDLIELYKHCEWPGNIRQLFGHLEKKVVLSCSSYLEVDELDKNLHHHSPLPNPHLYGESILSLEEVRQNYTSWVLNKVGQNKKLAAELLDITPVTLRSIIEKNKVLSLPNVASGF